MRKYQEILYWTAKNLWKLWVLLMILAVLQQFAVFHDKSAWKCQLKKEENLFIKIKKEEIMLKRENCELCFGVTPYVQGIKKLIWEYVLLVDWCIIILFFLIVENKRKVQFLYKKRLRSHLIFVHLRKKLKFWKLNNSCW